MARLKSSNGSTRSTAPNRIASFGMPKTTQVASSWAIVLDARVAHLFQATSAVITHSSHDDPESVAPGGLGGRSEQHIDGGTVTIDRRPVTNFDKVLRPTALKQHMFTAWGDQGATRYDSIVVLRFLDRNTTQPIQPSRERSREGCRHVLHDHHGRDRPPGARSTRPEGSAFRPSSTPIATTCSVVRVIARSPAGARITSAVFFVSLRGTRPPPHGKRCALRSPAPPLEPPPATLERLRSGIA